jgi:hypothetical protein
MPMSHEQHFSSRTHAFHTVPNDPVPSFSSSVYATAGSASVRFGDIEGVQVEVRGGEETSCE